MIYERAGWDSKGRLGWGFDRGERERYIYIYTRWRGGRGGVEKKGDGRLSWNGMGWDGRKPEKKGKIAPDMDIYGHRAWRWRIACMHRSEARGCCS